MDIQKEANRIAQDYGFDKATYWCKWEGYDIYAAELNDPNQLICIGQPVIILANENEVRLAAEVEWQAIFDANPNE